MAYLCGSTYIWSDGERVHLWSQDGLDHWQDTEFGQHPEASGVALREAITDQFVCMRFAQLIAGGRLEAAVRDTLEAAKGNVACEALTKLGPAILEHFRGIS